MLIALLLTALTATAGEDACSGGGVPAVDGCVPPSGTGSPEDSLTSSGGDTAGSGEGERAITVVS